MGVRILHLSDLHLGSRHGWLGDRAENRTREILETFRKAIGFAIDPERRIDAVIITGNLFDRHRPDPETWAFTRGLLGRLVAAQKAVVVIPGVRDGIGYKDGVFRTERWPGVDVILSASPDSPLTKTFSGGTVHFYGAAFQPGHSETEFRGFERKEAEGFHVGLLAAALPDHPEWAVRTHDQIIAPEVIAASGLDYLALGGYHELTPLRCGTTTAAYAGTLEGRRIEKGDLGQKSLLVVELEPSEPQESGSTASVRLETHGISQRVLADVEINLEAERIADADALLASLMARGSPETIARITLTGSLEFLCDLDEVVEKLSDRFYHLELVDRTDLLGSSLLRRLEGESTIRGFFVRRMTQRIAGLLERSRSAAKDAPVHRDLKVTRLALRLGLEQFLEEDSIPELRPAPAALSAESMPQKTAAPAMPVAIPETILRNGAGRAHPSERNRRILVADRPMQDGSAAEEGQS